jgi:preprotein translocase subunit SecG
MFEILFTIVHVLVCMLLIGAVLLQSGKGGGLAGSIGGGMGSSSVLGGRTATTFLSKATTVLAAVFMVSCLVQSIAFQNQQQGPTTATERMIEEGALPPVAPAPLEGGSLLGEPPAETTTETSTEGGSQTE